MKKTRLGNRCWSLCAGLAVLALSFGTSEAWAQDATTQSLTTTVTRTLASDSRLGGCAALLGDSVGTTTGLNCGDWVVFNCDGSNETQKSDAMRLFDSAQLAFVTGRRVMVWVDQERKIEDFCFAPRIDVLSE